MLIQNLENHLEERKGAIHVGGHDAEERKWYILNGFHKVVWFEPNIELFERLSKNIKVYPNNAAFNYGVHDTFKKVDLNISNNDGQSSSILPLGTHAKRHPDVHYVKTQEIQCVRLDEWFHDSIDDYNFLNIDVQGVELNVIKSFGTLITKMDYIYLEVNAEELYKGCALLPEVDNYLEQYGFERVETLITKAQWGDALYIKKKQS